MSEYLKEQVLLHPSMMPQDVIKLIFQASFGAEHLLKDFKQAEKMLIEEYDSVEACDLTYGQKEEALYENISESICRVNLRVWKQKGLPIEWLCHMFMEAATQISLNGLFMRDEKRRFFADAVADAEEMVKEGCFCFGLEEWQLFLRAYPMDEPVAVHHSQNYRDVEEPAYRLINRKFERVFPILEALSKVEGEGTKVVAIEGRCGAGKTTLAKLLANVLDGGVIHMDDFFLPMELRTPERYVQPGGNIDYERFVAEVLPQIYNQEAFPYNRFDCRRMEVVGERWIGPGKLRIVEGVYSCHPKFGDYMTLKVFCDVDKEEQLKRIAERDGEGAVVNYQEKWIPMEETYFTEFSIREKADVVV